MLTCAFLEGLRGVMTGQLVLMCSFSLQDITLCFPENLSRVLDLHREGLSSSLSCLLTVYYQEIPSLRTLNPPNFESDARGFHTIAPPIYAFNEPEWREHLTAECEMRVYNETIFTYIVHALFSAVFLCIISQHPGLHTPLCAVNLS